VSSSLFGGGLTPLTKVHLGHVYAGAKNPGGNPELSGYMQVAPLRKESRELKSSHMRLTGRLSKQKSLVDRGSFQWALGQTGEL